MKHTFLIFALIGCSLLGKAQRITSAKFIISDHGKGIRSVELVIDSNTVVMISGSGELISADTYDGREYNDVDYSRDKQFEYYGDFDKDKAGKLKSIGKLKIDYYSTFDIHDKPGNIKSIGDIKFTYYNTFDIHDQPGNLKTIGAIKLTYYNTFDIHDPQGKVKTVGGVKVTYFNKFDSDRLFGKVKTIKGNTKAVYIIATNRSR
ncbi:hypothetical protein [Pedobacter metabolipauper]|uniref:Uncharacterized protein n=1 Tax=Pedobacter metabolipauper TaxID=425513 RepID=A0A4V3D1I2_9SPHI|nr:hypothetical protein [Pedobacter metabolipauper]TDQ11283.1 hypothetical protein ATK78_0401 [Pedobacter metabolipauper]